MTSRRSESEGVNPYESTIQRQVVSYLRRPDSLLVRVGREGGHSTYSDGARMRMQGADDGWPDLMIHDRPPRLPQYVGVAWELKRKGFKATDVQREKHRQLRERGWLVEVWDSAPKAIARARALGWDW